MESLYIVMPAYNEQDNIKKTITEWYSVLEFANENSRLVIADSGSTDSTHEILTHLQKDFPQLIILSNTGKYHGPKLMSLYKYAIENSADYIFQTDSDGQTNPKEFEYFWNQRKNYDAVIGNRTRRGDGKSRHLIEKIVCLILKIFFGIKVPDANAPYRLMKKEILNKYIGKLPNDYNIPNIMLTTYFSYYKENILFKEISFKPRQAGVNSINLSKIFKIGWKAISDFEKFKKEM